MDNTLLINPKTGQEYDDVPPVVAAKYLGVALNFVYDGLKQKALPIGTAVHSEKGRWTYNIPCNRLKAYARGVDVLQTTQLLEMLLSRKEGR